MTNQRLKDILDGIRGRAKEEKCMNASDITINFGGKTYAPNSVNWIQELGEFPRMEIDAYISPYKVISGVSNSKTASNTLTITNVIFNPPATIVFWSDKTKTVVKCDYDYEDYDPEKGMAMAIAKKMMGNNKYEYYNTFLHWLKKYYKQHKKTDEMENVTIGDFFVAGEWNGEMCDA